MNRPSKSRWHLAAALPLALAVACTVGPDHVPPVAAVPAAFHEKDAMLTAAPAELASWWKQLHDPLLDQLVERAIRNNLDLEEALARVLEARALRGLAQAEYLPTADARAGYQRLGESENTPLGGFAVDSDRFTVGVDAAWELDLWGRVRRSVEAADADLDARVEVARDVLVAVVADVAANYVHLRELQERIAIARNNVGLQEQTQNLVDARFASGLVGERDTAQARRNLASTRSHIPSLEAAQRTAENRLAVLLGVAPGELSAEFDGTRPIPVPPPEVAVGVPADVVRQRPDVRAAERELAAQTARIGIAEADLYPRLALFGSVGLEAEHLPDLFEDASSVLAVGPSLRWNLFDAGRVRRQIAAQDARAQQALVQWRRTVLAALEQAENAMTAFVREQTRRTHLAEAATQARRAVQFASAQYTEGLTDFQNVLDSERESADLEDQLAQSRAAITGNLIALYRALGGGWENAMPLGNRAGETP
ncbi:MAG TPA: efflux transporter outer membrane subunit [Planctomycetota bacterium]|nr:efflux transporter outer membrane subunit [Planctomycetota bacterium]